MKVRDIMTKDVKSCRSVDSLAKALRTMVDADCGILPIISKESKVTGVITDRDIAVALLKKDRAPSEMLVSEVPAARLYACAPNDDIDDALLIMRRSQVRRLPIIDEEEKLVGILSMNDVASHAKAENGRKPALSFEKVVTTMKAICRHQKARALRRAAATAVQARA